MGYAYRNIGIEGIVKEKEEKHDIITEEKDYPLSDKISRFKNSIAVLPFQDMSPQKDQEYFCDGMTEEIINSLAHVGSLKVIARTSAYAFKGKQKIYVKSAKNLMLRHFLRAVFGKMVINFA